MNSRRLRSLLKRSKMKRLRLLQRQVKLKKKAREKVMRN